MAIFFLRNLPFVLKTGQGDGRKSETLLDLKIHGFKTFYDTLMRVTM